MGCDYRVPVLHGLLNKNFINDLKASSTFKEDAFAREYLGLWTGGGDDSWFDYDKLQKYRTIVNPEKRNKFREGEEGFYYISVDVARVGVLTSVQVVKVLPGPDYFKKRLVYSTGFHDMHFSLQSIEIKKLYQAYKPKEICIDGTGLGVGLMDFIVMEQVGADGAIYPPLGCINSEDYMNYSGDRVVYLLKASAGENSEIHNNCYTQIANGHVRFLIKEQEAKNKLLATKKGQKMNAIERLNRLMPHMETTRLFEEMCNLRIKITGTNTAVEQISKKINKDRFSAFEYALWRIKTFEEAYYKKKSRKRYDLKQFVFYSKGGKNQ